MELGSFVVRPDWKSFRRHVMSTLAMESCWNGSLGRFRVHVGFSVSQLLHELLDSLVGRRRWSTSVRSGLGDGSRKSVSDTACGTWRKRGDKTSRRPIARRA